MQNIETDDSVSSVGQFDQDYDELTEVLESYFLLQEHYEAVCGLDPDKSFRLKYNDLSRSALHSFRHHGLIQDAGIEQGAVTTWEWTPRGKLTLWQLKEDTFDAIPELDVQEYNTFERHYDLIVDELPHNTSAEFLAEEYEINDGTVAALSRHGFLEAVEKRQGRPNTWTTSEATHWLQAFMGRAE